MAASALNNLARLAVGGGAAISLFQSSIYNVDGGFRAVMFDLLRGVQVPRSRTRAVADRRARAMCAHPSKELVPCRCDCTLPVSVRRALEKPAQRFRCAPPHRAPARCQDVVWHRTRGKQTLRCEP